MWLSNNECGVCSGLPTSLTCEPATGSTSNKEYFVAANDPGSSDDNNGSIDAPFRTIQKAASLALAGDTIHVREGTYAEWGIVFSHAGAEGAPITLTNYQNENSILDGSSSTDDGQPGILFRPGCSHFVVENLTIRNMPDSGIATDDRINSTDERYRDITIRGCTLSDNGGTGLNLAATDGFLIDNIEAQRNANDGADIGSSRDGSISSSNGIVKNSVFSHHTGDQGHGLAINQGHDISISDCTAYHNFIHGIDISDYPKQGLLSHDIIVERCFSYDNVHAGFSVNSDSHHVKFHHNIATHNGAHWGDSRMVELGRCGGPKCVYHGFICYEGCWHVEWYNNVAFQNTENGFAVVEPPDTAYAEPLLVFKNNIAFNNGIPDSPDERGALFVEGTWWNLDVKNNDFYAENFPGNTDVVDVVYYLGNRYSVADVQNGNPSDPTNMAFDPMFENPSLMPPDVHLKGGSQCIDAGVNVGLDYKGNAPDLGAFELM